MLAQEFNNGGQNGDDDDGDDDQGKIIFDERNIAKIISAENEKSRPGYAADNVVAYKPPITHLADSGDKRRESADDRNKSRDYNCFPSVFFVKLVSALKIFFIQKQTGFFLKYFRADKTANPIIYGIADYCRQRQKDKKPIDI